MELRDFHNRLRVLLNLDRDELVAAGVMVHGDHNAWGTFHRDPFRWLIRADDATAEKLWAVIELRTCTKPAIRRRIAVNPPVINLRRSDRRTGGAT